MSTILNTRYATCKKCGEKHDDLLHKHCVTCRITMALYGREWYADHIARKLCGKCCKSSKYDNKTRHRFARCNYHLKYDREMAISIYARKRKKNLKTIKRAA